MNSDMDDRKHRADDGDLRTEVRRAMTEVGRLTAEAESGERRAEEAVDGEG